MEKEKRKIPEIRFPGFTDDWEQRKLGDIADIKDSARISNELWVENGIPYLRSSDLVNGELNGELFISKETYEGYASKTGAPQKDDVLFTSGGKVGVVYHKKDESPVYVQGGAVLYVKTSTSNLLDGSFLSIYFGSPRMQTYMDIASSGGTIKHFTLKPANASPIIFPGLSEQQKIGAFFKELDKTIALHQSKLEVLKNSKQTLLQKMFPKNGENVPELRFPGFTEAWEQRRLKEITERVRGNDGRMDLPTLTISAGSGWLDQRERFSGNIAGKEQKNYTLLKKGQLSYNHGNSKLAKYGAVFELKTYNEALVPRVYHSFGTNELSNPNFIEYMFVTKRPDKELAKLVSSGARMDGLLNINFDEFMGINVNIPSVGEQKKIGSFFEQLDDIIALHQHELEKLKQLKQNLLNKLFV